MGTFFVQEILYTTLQFVSKTSQNKGKASREGTLEAFGWF